MEIKTEQTNINNFIAMEQLANNSNFSSDKKVEVKQEDIQPCEQFFQNIINVNEKSCANGRFELNNFLKNGKTSNGSKYFTVGKNVLTCRSLDKNNADANDAGTAVSKNSVGDVESGFNVRVPLCGVNLGVLWKQELDIFPKKIKAVRVGNKYEAKITSEPCDVFDYLTEIDNDLANSNQNVLADEAYWFETVPNVINDNNEQTITSAKDNNVYVRRRLNVGTPVRFTTELNKYAAYLSINDLERMKYSSLCYSSKDMDAEVFYRDAIDNEIKRYKIDLYKYLVLNGVYGSSKMSNIYSINTSSTANGANEIFNALYNTGTGTPVPLTEQDPVTFLKTLQSFGRVLSSGDGIFHPYESGLLTLSYDDVSVLKHKYLTPTIENAKGIVSHEIMSKVSVGDDYLSALLTIGKMALDRGDDADNFEIAYLKDLTGVYSGGKFVSKDDKTYLKYYGNTLYANKLQQTTKRINFWHDKKFFKAKFLLKDKLLGKSGFEDMQNLHKFDSYVQNSPLERDALVFSSFTPVVCPSFASVTKNTCRACMMQLPA